MVMIGNYELSTSMFSGLGSSVVSALMIGAVSIIIMGAIGFYVWNTFKKKQFNIPVTFLTLRDNNTFIENPNILGGLVKHRSGAKTFKLKIPGSYFKQDLGFVPDMSLAGPDNRITFVRQGDGTGLQQCKKELVAYEDVPSPDGKQIIRYRLLIKPIPTDTKITTINAIHDVDNIVDKNKMTAFAISIIAFIIMAIVQILFLYFTRKR